MSASSRKEQEILQALLQSFLEDMGNERKLIPWVEMVPCLLGKEIRAIPQDPGGGGGRDVYTHLRQREQCLSWQLLGPHRRCWSLFS